jgi:putative ATP-binding cassette transporter
LLVDMPPGEPRRPAVPVSAAKPGTGLAAALRQLRVLLAALRRSRFFKPCGLLALGIVVVVALNMVGQVRLNAWQGDFFNALAERQVDVLLEQSLVFIAIIAVLLTLVVGETWFRELLEVRLREWLTRDLLDQWVAGRRPFMLTFAGDMAANPDQRMQADALKLTELSIALGIGLLRSVLQLASFLGVLWALSAETTFVIGGNEVRIPGYLVWCALAYAISGSWLTWRVGRPLVGINAERYAREAELRFSLVRINENAEVIALYGGTPDERRGLDRPVDAVVEVTRRLANALARLTWITSGYGWLGLIVPVLAAAPGYFQGSLSFGGLMMAVGAFNQVQAALRWFVEYFPLIADWRATLLRVASFRELLPTLDTPAAERSRIDYAVDGDDRIVLDGLRIAVNGGEIVLDEPRLELRPGERLLLVGRRGIGKSTFFNALAGLWPYGAGRILMPAPDRVMFVPERPYLPLGTLRAAVAYPADQTRIDEATMVAGLERVGLGHLTGALDEERRWDQELGFEDQQRLIVARLLLHRPRVVVMDEALSALDADRRDLFLSIFRNELSGASVVGFGDELSADGFYDRHVTMRRRP